MGLSCAGIHLFMAAGGATAPLESADRVFERACGKLGLRRTGVPSDAVRHLAVVNRWPWLSVWDVDGPAVVSEELAELAGVMSAEGARPVVLASVHDSDAFVFLLFEEGRQVDGYESDEGYLPPGFRKWSKSRRAGEWNRVFSRELDAKAVAAVTRPPRSPFADDGLAALCRVLELPVERASLSGADWKSGAGPAADHYYFAKADAGAAVTQEARPGCQMAWAEAAESTGEWEVKGLPLLVGESTVLAFELSAKAGSLADPVFELSGSGVESGLVEMAGCHGIWHGGTRPRVLAGDVRRVEAQLEAEDRGGRRLYRARLQGVSVREGPFAAGTQTTLALLVGVRGKAEGRGEFEVSCQPDRGAAARLPLAPRYRAEVWAPRWVPLDCRVGSGVLADTGIRALNDPRMHSGVVIVEDRGEEPLEMVRALMERWLASRAGQAESVVSVLREDQMSGPALRIAKRKKQLAAAQIGAGNPWSRLFDRGEKLQSLFVSLVDESGRAWAGAMVQRPCFDPLTDSAGGGALHAAFWVEAGREAGPVPPEGAAVEVVNELSGLVDSAFGSLAGMQGWVACWEWIPRFSMGDENNYTPYEDAHGLGRTSEPDPDGGFMSKRWCGRRLRGIGSRTWLGAELLGHVAMDRLARVGEVSATHGPGVRVELRADASLNELEEAVEMILPPHGK